MFKRWFSPQGIITFVIVIILFQLAGYFGWSFIQLIVIIFLVTLAQVPIQVVYQRIAFGWYRQLHAHLKGMQDSREAAETILANLRAKYEAGARDFPTLAAYATAYSHLGRGAEAEPIVREAQAIAEQKGVCQQNTRSARLMCDTAIVLQRDAWNTQGRFGEAAQLLRARIPDSFTPNWFTAIVAYDFFLAEDMYNARVALSHLKPPGNNPRDTDTWIGPHFHFMIPYLRYKLFGDDPRAALYEHEDQLAHWEENAALNAENPAGARLAVMLAEIRELVKDEDNNDS